MAIGASGGLLPCPEALGVMIVAVSLRRQLFGMAMIVSFSVGLASVLVGLGIALVHTKGLVARVSAAPNAVAFTWVPIASAAIVTLFGLAMLTGYVI